MVGKKREQWSADLLEWIRASSDGRSTAEILAKGVALRGGPWNMWSVESWVQRNTYRGTDGLRFARDTARYVPAKKAQAPLPTPPSDIMLQSELARIYGFLEGAGVLNEGEHKITDIVPALRKLARRDVQ